MKDTIKYFLYARKSTEGDEKQVQSLEDQTNVMKKKAKDLGIEIIEILQESMSAKSPGRYKFNEMIGRIQNGEAEGIIAWKIDRLTRNPIDTGTIQFMLQNGTLSKIITSDRDYNPVDAGLLFSVETGMANQYILDLRKNVLRGMNSKTDKGWFCGYAPEGYINNRLNKTIEIDEDNFPFIQKAWNLMTTGSYSVPQVVKIANEKWGYTSKKKKGKKLTESGMYGVFKNPFYTGSFLWKGEIKEGNHTPMITWEQYERVQKLIGEKGHTIRGKTKEFAFTGMMKCGECGCSIVAEEKNKYIKTKNIFKKYIYYRCSKRSKGCACKQKPTNLAKLEDQINHITSNIEILPEFREWGKEILKRDSHKIFEDRNQVLENLEREISSIDNKQQVLLNYLLDNTITKEIYTERKGSLNKTLHKLKNQREKMDTNKDESIKYTEELLDFIMQLENKFNTGTLREKKIIFSRLGENFTLKDGILSLELHPWIGLLNERLPEIKRKHRALEPSKRASGKGKPETQEAIISLWSGGPGLNWHTRGLKPQYTHSIMLPPHLLV